jgi:hypothetical protein
MDVNKNLIQDQYERPNFPYQCGRIDFWKKKCVRGPTINGECGGNTECQPALKDNRWFCKRLAKHGGDCEDGPLPDGKCSKTNSFLCKPSLTKKKFKNKLMVLGLGFSFCFIGAFDTLNVNSEFGFTTQHIKTISQQHSHFIGGGKCKVCHVAHGKTLLNLGKEIFKSQDISKKCLDCHNFVGSGLVAHNFSAKESVNAKRIQCQKCHKEHDSETNLTKSLNRKQCNSCHKLKFKSFTVGHPDFTDNYPNFNRNSIKFNHISHFNKYFESPKHKNNTPLGCVACHKKNVNLKNSYNYGYDKACSKCHESQILKKKFTLFRLPELLSNNFDNDLLKDNCINFSKGVDASSFESISIESLNKVMTFLLKVPEDEPKIYNQLVQKFILSLIEEGTKKFSYLLNDYTSESLAAEMLTGLSFETVQAAACDWVLNLEYEPNVNTASAAGWHSDLLEIAYNPIGHNDPVIKSWIEFVLKVSSLKLEKDQEQRLMNLRNELLSPQKGPGGCIKCHSITEMKENGNKVVNINWNYNKISRKAHNYFSHNDHKNFFDMKKNCATCHIFDQDSDYFSSFNSFEVKKITGNFKPITRKICLSCHTESGININCQSCHRYHNQASIINPHVNLNKT